MIQDLAFGRAKFHHLIHHFLLWREILGVTRESADDLLGLRFWTPLQLTLHSGGLKRVQASFDSTEEPIGAHWEALRPIPELLE